MSRRRDKCLVRAVQARAARSAAGPSATRSQGVGVAEAAQTYLKELRLRPFGTSRAQKFQQRLDEATEGLRLALPKRSRRWGLARKVLNIFVRDALYTKILADNFQIAKAEWHLEVPLDRITSSKLRKLAGKGKLPRWRGIKHLTREDNAAYQQFAMAHAKDKYPAMARVHLDAFWWGLRDDELCD